MCEPIYFAAAAVAISLASGVTSYVQGKRNAEAEVDAANKAAISDYNRATLQQQQIDAAGSLDMTERLRQSLKERAAIRVSAGEAGLTTGREEIAAHQSASKDLAIMEANKSGSIEQIQAEKGAILANAQSRINLANSRTPTPWMAGLQITSSAASSGLGAYATAKSIK